jgi:hypothetical protein
MLKGVFILATYTLVSCATTAFSQASHSKSVAIKTAGLSEFDPQGEPAVGKFSDNDGGEIVEEFIWGQNRKDHKFHIYEKQWTLQQGIGTPVRDWLDVGAIDDHNWKGSPDFTKLSIKILHGPSSSSNATRHDRRHIRLFADVYIFYPIPIRRGIVVSELSVNKSQASKTHTISYDDSNDNSSDRSNPKIDWDYAVQ